MALFPKYMQEVLSPPTLFSFLFSLFCACSKPVVVEDRKAQH